MTRNKFDIPIFIIFLFLLTIVINTISSILFMNITLAGIIFTAFFVCVKRGYYYSLILCILSFLFIELNSGLKPFSLSLLSMFIYLFIIPNIKKVITYAKVNTYVYMIIFYFGVAILWSFQSGVNEVLILSLIINIFIDFIFFGVLI